MPDGLDSSGVFEFAVYLKSKLGLDFDLSTYEDLDINFIEAVFGCIVPNYVPSTQFVNKRFQYILQWLSNSLNVSLDHISLDALVLYDPASVNDILELLDLCLNPGAFGDSQSVHSESSKRFVSGHRDQRDPSASVTLPQDSTVMDLNQSRLQYLQCKLFEMYQSGNGETFSKGSVPCEPSDAPDVSCPHVKFADVPPEEPPEKASTLMDQCLSRSRRLSRSIIRMVEKPLSHRLSCEESRRITPHALSLYSYDSQRRSRWSQIVPLSKLPRRDGDAFLEALLKHFEGIELSRETGNYVRTKLQLFYGGNRRRPERHSMEESRLSRKLSEVIERQQKRLDLIKRQTEHAERIRCLRDTQLFEHRLAFDLKERKRQEVLARHHYQQQVEQLKCLKLAQKAEDERMFVKVFKTALNHERQWKNEERSLKREARQKESELRDVILSDLENRHTETIRLLNDEQSKLQAQLDLEARANRSENLQAKMELRQRLMQQIKKLEEILLNETNPRNFVEHDESHALSG
ncbi:unnamed protein product [Mesocestoides corti]|uniref:Uncharacterized protein n=1 Tax=Mesocestoides corti TaxID=53468 RepID=A0A0R3UEK6_MESCO|nr:unnamed protein product [Mesocestoides corti]